MTSAYLPDYNQFPSLLPCPSLIDGSFGLELLYTTLVYITLQTTLNQIMFFKKNRDPLLRPAPSCQNTRLTPNIPYSGTGATEAQ